MLVDVRLLSFLQRIFRRVFFFGWEETGEDTGAVALANSPKQGRAPIGMVGSVAVNGNY